MGTATPAALRTSVRARVDSARQRAHPIHVPLLIRRIAALALITFLSGGGSGLCAGWEGTAEARMACCTEGGTCPMHTSSADGMTEVVTQAEADSCCASSEGDDATPSSPAFVLAVALTPSLGPLAMEPPPGLLHLNAWRTSVRPPGSHVPRHVLLAVFLI